MTTLSSWAYTQPLTFWSVANDAFGQPTFTLAFTAIGTWMSGGSVQTSDDGVQFIPAGQYWIERASGAPRPSRGWKVAIGTLTGLPPASAEIIRKTGADDDAVHGFTSVDWVMWT